MINVQQLIKNYLKNSTKIFLTKFILIIFSFCFLFNIYKKINFIINFKIINNKENNEYNLLKYYNNLEGIFEYFNIIDIKIIYNNKYEIIKIEYKIEFFDNHKNIILPSDLILYKKVHIFCYLKINSQLEIISIANIVENKFFNCIEFYNTNEKINIGIIIYQNIDDNYLEKYYSIYYISKELFNKNKISIYKDKCLYDPLYANKEYLLLSFRMNDIHINETLKFKKSYIKYPYCSLKRNTILNENIWYFRNINNNYFCFCKGLNCLNSNISKKCKYYFYLNIIDNNRYIYEKTDYLFLDFIFNEYSSDDVYPIFKEMANKNYPVHYITENFDFYQQYCHKKSKCLTIILVNKQNYTMNGDFIEKYLTLFLKLKKVISGGGIYFNYINNLFYNLNYITYICVGHGVSFLKNFLYANFSCYGHKIYDKILIPPSDKLVSMALKYGWNYQNIIRINLPRWDKYNILNNKTYILKDNKTIRNNSIYLMFTWRDIKKNKIISKFYFKNILNLIHNNQLESALNKNNINLYFTLHHKLRIFKNKLKLNKNMQYIEENVISLCLEKIDLLVSDFSSIIFDIIYRRKPYIIYIPDGNDPKIINNYKKNYYELIESIKNGTIYFENKYFELNETINKIIYYINNNFNLEPKLEQFYDTFKLKKGRIMNEFINILTN